MFDTLFTSEPAAARHSSGPLAAEREQYLRHCKSVGATDLTQRNRARAMLRIACTLSPDDREGIDADRLQNLIEALSPRPTAIAAANVLNTTRPWFKFLGWWREPEPPEAFVDELDEFVRWMREERGLAPCTIDQWRDRCATFLLWCAQTGRSLADLKPEDIDAYFATYGAGRWSRTSVRYIATMLRVFLRHAVLAPTEN